MLEKFCRIFKCEALARYDLKTDKWYGHLYSTRNSSVRIDAEFSADSYGELIEQIQNEVSNQRRMIACRN